MSLNTFCEFEVPVRLLSSYHDDSASSSPPASEQRPLSSQAMLNPRHVGSTASLTIVIKLGTSSIIDADTHMPLLTLLSSIVETICKLKALGHRVVLVSSGAIGVGLKRMGMKSRGKGLSEKQVSLEERTAC
jgi:glutamate 5-kinase